MKKGGKDLKEKQKKNIEKENEIAMTSMQELTNISDD